MPARVPQVAVLGAGGWVRWMKRLPERVVARGSPRLRGLVAAALVSTVMLPGLGCSHYAQGRYHTVSQGENLYRIGLRYGVDSRTLARANGIEDVTELRIGQRLWVPTASPAVSSAGPSRSTARSDPKATARAREAARREARARSDLNFIWPVPAKTITSRYGRRNGRPHEGIDIRARRGTRIRAAESGKVIHAGWLGDYGKVVIIKHAGHYRTVYAHADKIYVKRGQFVDKGQRIAAVGTTGKSTGPHLHFEVRRGETPRDPMRYLP